MVHHDGCAVCGSPRSRGVLCEPCAAGLGHDELCPEQVGARLQLPKADHANAWLIDGWGTPHTLAVPLSAPSAMRQVTLGRDRRCDLWVAERTISQTHATLEHRPLSNAWFVVDAGSDNGVFVNDDRVPRRFPLEPFDRISLGRRVGFIFVPIEPAGVEAAIDELQWLRTQNWAEDTVGDGDDDSAVPLRVSAVTEGGAVAAWGQERAALSELEYELIATLHRRMLDDGALDEAARGYVPAAHLLEALSFRSEGPTHANLRGLVRKLRRKLADRDHPIDVIESRQGLGYRLARPIVLG